MISPGERQYILAQIGRTAAADLDALWRQAEVLPSSEFAAWVIEAFPTLADPYAAVAADAAATWYGESPGPSGYVPIVGPLPEVAQLTASATWALGADGLIGRDRLQGTLQRAVWDSARSTVLANVDAESGSSWARHASSNACAFCALMASRGAAYNSKAAAESVVGRGKEMSLGDRRARAAGQTRVNGHTAAGGIRERGVRKLGDKYHDHCHCIAVEVRPGQTYQPPEYVQKWDEAYIAASRETPKVGKYDAIDPKAVLAHMRESLGSK